MYKILTESMNSKSLMELYEKFIPGESNTHSLISLKKLSSVKKNYSSSQMARIRFSDEYLELIDDKKIFNETIEALKYFYTSDHDLKLSQFGTLPQFYNFLFKHIFSHSEKQLLEEIIQAEFNGRNSRTRRWGYQRDNQKRKKQQKNHLGTQNGCKNTETKEKHIFMELLDSMLWDEETLTQKEAQEKKIKKKEKTNQNQKEFSIAKIMQILM